MKPNAEPSPSLPELAAAGKVSLVRLGKTLGDTLFLSTVAHELRKRHPACEITIHSHWPLLFHNNPDVARSQQIFEPRLPEGIAIGYETTWPPPRHRHILQTICDNAGLGGDLVTPRTYYYPTPEEQRHAREICQESDRPLVVVHPFSGFFAPRTKQWHFSNWKELIELLPQDIETLRFTTPDEPATPGERPFHRDIQTTDVRLIASLLERADAFIGHESGLAHLATALGIPSVVIFTGYVPPEVFGYEQNINLVPDLPYIPCWQGDGCAPCHGEICTRSVTPRQVLDAFLGLLGRNGAGT